MDFEKFGVVSYTTAAKVSPFVDYLAEGKFMTTQCAECKTIFYPPQMDCPVCLKSNIEWLAICSKGKLLSYTTAHYGPAGLEDKVPYTLGIVEFPEGIRVLAPISEDIASKDLRVGMELKIVTTKLGENRVGFELVRES